MSGSDGPIYRYTAMYSGEAKAYTVDDTASGDGVSNGEINYPFAIDPVSRNWAAILNSGEMWNDTHDFHESEGYRRLQTPIRTT